jgi:hypothetical protein
LKWPSDIDIASGDRLVETMTSCSDLVMFGAAIPQQGGYMHVNEQFQSYWIKRFADRGFNAYDLIRPRFWGNSAVNWWYQQNIIVFASNTAAQKYDLRPSPFIADVVHPRLYDWHRDPKNWGGRSMVRRLLEKAGARLGIGRR